MTSNSNLQLVQYKTIHRIHYTQSKLFIMGITDTDICPHCTLGCPDTYLYATWSCQPVNSLWTSVTKTLSTILDCSRVPLSPTLCLLVDTTSIPIPQKFKNPLLVSLTIAKKIVFQNWKSRVLQYKSLDSPNLRLHPYRRAHSSKTKKHQPSKTLGPPSLPFFKLCAQ